MGKLIEQQAVIECLTNTSKYYEREDADEWTKGIHYGLLHGVDNILDNVPTVETIPKEKMIEMYDKIIKTSYDIAESYPKYKGIMLYEAQMIIDIMKEYLFKENEDGKDN